MESKKQTNNKRDSKKDNNNKNSYLSKIEYENFKTFTDVAKAIADSLKTYVKQSPSGLGGSIVAHFTNCLKNAL